MRASLLRTIGMLSLLAGLQACSDGQEELRGWVDTQRHDAKPRVQALQPPTKFEPKAYAGGTSVDPFSAQKLSVALKLEARQPNSLLAGELKRRKEPLEAHPLDSMSMVGSVTRQGQPFALLKIDNLLYQVKVGDYLGQNYGRVMKIDETQVVLREVVQDAVGEWVERPTNLQLQERAR